MAWASISDAAAGNLQVLRKPILAAMPDHAFVIVEFPLADTPLASATAKVPGCRIDVIAEPVVGEGGEKWHAAVVLIKGLPGPELTQLLVRLGKVYERIETIERDDLQGSWLGRMRMRESAMTHNKGAAVVLRFQHRFGALWSHIEAGILYLRAKVRDAAHGELLADQMRRYFAKAGVPAQVEVRDVSAKDYGVWEDLVQRSIGLAP